MSSGQSEVSSPLSSNPDQGRSSRSRTPPIPDEPILIAEETSTMSSSGYSPSPPPQEMNQPINLSNLLTLPGHGRGRGTARGQGESQGHGRRAFVQIDAPPSFSSSEVAEDHRDKRQCLNSSSTRIAPLEGTFTTRRSTASVPAWTHRETAL